MCTSCRQSQTRLQNIDIESISGDLESPGRLYDDPRAADPVMQCAFFGIKGGNDISEGKGYGTYDLGQASTQGLDIPHFTAINIYNFQAQGQFARSGPVLTYEKGPIGEIG